MSNSTITYVGKDQNWQDEQTVYWFDLVDYDYCISERFGVVEGDNEGIVDCDSCPIDGLGIERVISRALENAVTDEMRAE